MTFTAVVSRVMIASPGDVPEARRAVRQAIDSWNAANAAQRGLMLFPVGWETSSAPALGDRAQALINEQLGVCDVLVGVFWTRLGTPTGVALSGTIEEIDRHVSAGSIVMLYFCNMPVLPDTVDPEQLKAVHDAKRRYMEKGLIDSFDNTLELENKLIRSLSIHMRDKGSLQSISIVANSPPDRDRLGIAARDLLREAIKDSSGMVMKISFVGGMHIKTNGRNFVADPSPRERAKWEAAIEELVGDDLLQPVGHSGGIFYVTAEGYRRGDGL